VKLLAGRLAPQAGQMTVPPKLRVGYFAQHQQEELHLDESAFQQVRRLMPNATETQVRSHLGGFAFSGQTGDQTVGSFSGGEKARLLFAMMSLAAPHLMLLDEPTNHLDVDAREALIRALNDYSGAVVLVSHDPHLLELVCDRLWLVKDGTCRPYDGDLDEYKRHLQEERRERRRQAAEARADENGGDKLSKKDARRARAQARERNQELRRQVKEAEREIEKLTVKKDALEAKLSDPKVYGGSTRDLMELQLQHSEIKQKVEDAEARWLEAQSALEDADSADESAA
jgi:ATP-binding cassette, subfamily F, member 3